MARPGSVWLVCGLVTATLALLLAIGAVPLDAVIEGFVQRAIRQQVVWKPDSPAPVAGGAVERCSGTAGVRWGNWLRYSSLSPSTGASAACPRPVPP